MALDASVAGSAANSYLTVASADVIADTDLLGRNAKAWREATDEIKEAALMRATEDIDSYVGLTNRYSTTQALAFPRAIDNVVGPAIPPRVSKATYLHAAFLIRNADLLDDAASRRARGMSSFANPDGTGGTVDYDHDSGVNADPAVARLLQPFAQGAVVATIITT